MSTEIQLTRIRINAQAGELEVEGDEAFVRECLDRFSQLLEGSPRPKKRDKTPTPPAEERSDKDNGPEASESGLHDTLGEYLHRFPKDLNDQDRVLAAAYFIQSHSGDNTFTTRRANAALKEQGVKVSNASLCVRRHRKAKRLFNVDKTKFRVSKTGEEYLTALHENDA